MGAVRNDESTDHHRIHGVSDTDSVGPVHQWAVCELMGHVRLAGRLSEVEKFGVKMGQLDIPKGDGFYTRLFGGASVYSITMVDEATARIIAERSEVPPLNSWELPKQIAAPVETEGEKSQKRFDESANWGDGDQDTYH